MSKLVTVKCPGCNLELDTSHRNGDLIYCPACKTFYKVTLNKDNRLGACPYDCGETIIEDDLKDDGTLDCPFCHKVSFQRQTLEGSVLLQFKGICPDCGAKIGHSDCQDDGVTYVCPDCGQMLTSRDNYEVKVIKDYCPGCQSPLCVDDVVKTEGANGIEEVFKCCKCGNGFPFDSHTFKIPHTRLFAIPKLTLRDFRFRSFKKMMIVSPANVASEIHIGSENVHYVPLLPEHMTYPEKGHMFTTKISDIERAYGGKAEGLPEDGLEDTSSASLYVPEYSLKYTYMDSKERCFSANDFSDEISETNIPRDKNLINKSWGTYFILIVMVAVTVCTLVWLVKSSHGFFSNLFNLIGAAIILVIAFIVSIACSEGINNHMEASVTKRKIKDFKDLYGLEYTTEDSIKERNG